MTRNNVADPLVRVNNISKHFGSKTVLDKINLTIRPNQIITLIGPNGAGKTTLVHTILGLIQPDTGNITRATGLRIGYMPQRLSIDETLPLSVIRFLKFAEPNLNACQQALATVGIGHLSEQPVQRLSGGETQRMLLARAILRRPNLLVLDEPVQGVDITGQESLYRLISDLKDTLQCGILMVSHDLHLVMAATDEVVCLNHHICCHGSPESVSTHSEYTALFGERTALYNHKHDHSHGLNESVLTAGQAPAEGEGSNA